MLGPLQTRPRLRLQFGYQLPPVVNFSLCCKLANDFQATANNTSHNPTDNGRATSWAIPRRVIFVDRIIPNIRIQIEVVF